jgi:hypothetical protein
MTALFNLHNTSSSSKQGHIPFLSILWILRRHQGPRATNASKIVKRAVELYLEWRDITNMPGGTGGHLPTSVYYLIVQSRRDCGFARDLSSDLRSCYFISLANNRKTKARSRERTLYDLMH